MNTEELEYKIEKLIDTNNFTYMFDYILYRGMGLINKNDITISIPNVNFNKCIVARIENEQLSIRRVYIQRLKGDLK